MENFVWNSNKKNENSITLELDKQKIPEDWNFSFMKMLTDALQTLRPRIQATVPPNRIANNLLSSV